MSAPVRHIPFGVYGYGAGVGEGRASVRVLDRAQRMGRAAAGLGVAWGAALASVFIPVAHFLLVPACLAFGVYLLATRLRAHSVVIAIEGTCPDCHAAQQFEPGGPWRLPRPLACASCGRALTARAPSPDPTLPRPAREE